MSASRPEAPYEDYNCPSVREEFEIRHFARQFALSTDQVRNLITRFGNSRERLELAVKFLQH